MERLTVSCLRLRTLVVAVAAVILGAGFWQISKTPLDAVPEFSPVTLQVRTEALGLSAAEVESLITVPLEADLLIGVPWLKSIDSESVAGVSSIDLLFEPGTDLMRARQMVNERMTQARALPNVSSPPTLLLPVATANRIMNIGLSSNSVSLIDMSVQAQWTVLPRLTGIPGVANVSIWGQRNRQVQVQVNPAKLHAKGVTLDQVIKTAGEAVWASPLTYLNSSTPGTGGFIDTPNQRLNVRHVFPITAAEDFANIPVQGTALALREVADVVEGHQPLIGDAIIKDGPGLLLVIEKYPGFNTVQVTNAVEAALNELRPGLTGIDIDTEIFRPASFIERATTNLSNTIIAGAILAALSLALLLGSWRATVVAIVAVALSLAAAGLIFYLRGVDFNMMVIAGLLAISAVVDDAIVDARNIQTRLREAPGADTRPRWRIIASASAEARGSMVYATVILVIAVAPLLLLQGLSAEFFRPLAWSCITAVLVSMGVAITVTPALAMLIINSTTAAKQAPGPIGGIRQWYTRLSARIIRSPVPIVALLVAAVLTGALLWAQQPRSLVPSFKETDVFVELQGPAGSSLPAMQHSTEALMKSLLAIPGIKDAAAQIGRATLSRDIGDVDSATIWLSLDPNSDYDQVLAAITKNVDAAPDLNGSVQAFLAKKLRESLTGEDQAISIRVYGQDLGILRAKAQEIRQRLGKIKGIKDPEVEPQPEQQAIDIEVDLDKARAHGLKPGDVRRAASALIGGITVGSLFQEQKIFDVVIWGDPGIRKNIDNIRNLLIDTESGGQVRLVDVARVDLVSSPSVIHRQGASRRIDVEAEVSGRSLGAVTDEVRQMIKDMAFPFEYHAEVLGEHVERQAALRSLYSYLIAAAVGIVLLLQAAMGSWLLAGLVCIAVFTSLLGGFLATYLAGGVISLGSLLGLATVAALALRNQLLQLRQFQHREQTSAERAELAVPEAAGELMPSILASAITTGMAVLPFVILGSVAGLEILHPAALVILGGLVSASLVTLLLIPAVYLRVSGKATGKTPALAPRVA